MINHIYGVAEAFPLYLCDILIWLTRKECQSDIV